MSAPSKPSKPGLVRVFKALYTYEATQSDELSFHEGEMLYIPATEIAGANETAGAAQFRNRNCTCCDGVRGGNGSSSYLHIAVF